MAKQPTAPHAADLPEPGIGAPWRPAPLPTPRMTWEAQIEVRRVGSKLDNRLWWYPSERRWAGIDPDGAWPEDLEADGWAVEPGDDVGLEWRWRPGVVEAFEPFEEGEW